MTPWAAKWAACWLATHDHIVDQNRIQAVALGKSAQRLRSEINRMPPGKGSIPFPHRRSNGVDDHSGFHGTLPE